MDMQKTLDDLYAAWFKTCEAKNVNPNVLENMTIERLGDAPIPDSLTANDLEALFSYIGMVNCIIEHRRRLEAAVRPKWRKDVEEAHGD